MIAYKASVLFSRAARSLDETDLTDFSDILIFLIDHIINQLIENKKLLHFIAKDLSWGIFKTALSSNDERVETDFYDSYLKLAKECNVTIANPEIMLFMIIELVGASCYNCILYSVPLTIEEYKPYLYQSIRSIIDSQVQPTLLT